jgi:hypothetical protein
MPVQETKGSASAQGYGFGLGSQATYIEDVFSTWLYTGNSSTQTITNGIDLAGKGGLVWTKARNLVTDQMWFDTARGVKQELGSNKTNAQSTNNIGITAFGATGYTTAQDNGLNGPYTYVSWSFRKQPKFFDVVTWTGDGNNSRTLAHNLASVPGSIIIKASSAVSNWWIITRFNDTTYKWGYLNSTGSFDTTSYSPSTIATSSVINIGYINQNIESVNQNGVTYVAYLFAHNAGGFGATGTDNVISCGSYTGNGSTQTVSLGYEPQYILYKQATGSIRDWMVFDSMRGLTMGTDIALFPNANYSESSGDAFNPTATGFVVNNNVSWNQSGETYIYIAIRRGPMKTPTTGTEVYGAYAKPLSQTVNQISLSFTSDLMIAKNRSGGTASGAYWFSRLVGMVNPSPFTISSSTAAETTQAGKQYAQNAESNYFYNVGPGANTNLEYNDSSNSSVFWFMRRAPGFFDEVCDTGTAVAKTVNHNLTIAPELIIRKRRSATAENWLVLATALGLSELRLNQTNAVAMDGSSWNNTLPTSSVFSVGSGADVNGSGLNYVTYLFATVAGVSKVGSYTGTGATLNINAGFTTGARFVMIKRTDSTGDWFYWDTARGMVSGTDPRLAMNSTAAETNADWVYTASSGFQIVTTDASVNASGGSYIYFAVA